MLQTITADRKLDCICAADVKLKPRPAGYIDADTDKTQRGPEWNGAGDDPQLCAQIFIAHCDDNFDDGEALWLHLGGRWEDWWDCEHISRLSARWCEARDDFHAGLRDNIPDEIATDYAQAVLDFGPKALDAWVTEAEDIMAAFAESAAQDDAGKKHASNVVAFAKQAEVRREQAKPAAVVYAPKVFFPGVDAMEDAETSWMVHHLIVANGYGLLAAQRGKGKTFIGLDMAHALGVLTDFAGYKIVENVGTMWVAAESWRQIPKRMRALPTKTGTWSFALLNRCPKLLDARGRIDANSIKFYIAEHKEAERRSLDMFGQRTGFIPFDTMMRVAGYLDENNPTQCANAMQALLDISEATGAFCLGIDHMGINATRVRGGTSKEDGDLLLYLDEDGRNMIVEKVREDTGDKTVGYMLDRVELGLDKYGEHDSTCRVQWDVQRHGRMTTKAKGPSKAEIMFGEALARAGGSLPIPEAKLREAHKAIYRERGYDPKTSAERTGWQRGIEANGLLIVGGAVQDKVPYRRSFDRGGDDAD